MWGSGERERRRMEEGETKNKSKKERERNHALPTVGAKIDLKGSITKRCEQFVEPVFI